MSYLIDTNVVSELRVSHRAHPSVLAWALGVPTTDAYISAITLLELERGVVKAESRRLPTSVALRTWMHDHVLPTYRSRTLSVDTAVALACAQFLDRHPVHDADLLIAATAKVHDLTVVTRNVADFDGLGVRILNPWSA